MITRIAILFTLFLAACGQDVRDLRLAEADLSNAAVVQRIGQQLEPADKVAFATYLALHGPSSARHCGQRPAGRDGKELHTIGDAIDFMGPMTPQIQPTGSGPT